MKNLHLTKEEKLELENNVLKENNFKLQIQQLQVERESIIKSFCEKNSKKPEEILNVDLQSGIITFKDEVTKKK